MGIGEIFTRRFWVNVSMGVTGTLIAAACLAAFTFQIQHYARAGESYEQQKINEDAIARVTKLAETLGERAAAEDAAADAEFALTRKWCLARILHDRNRCAAVGVEIP